MEKLLLFALSLSVGILFYIVSSMIFKNLSFSSILKSIKTSPRRLKILYFACVFIIVFILSSKIIIAVISVLVFYIVYDFLKHTYDRKRHINTEAKLIEVLGSVSSSVSAGQSLFQSLEYAAKATNGKVADLLSETVERAKLGEPIKDALLRIPGELKNKEVKIAIDSMIISQETGANLSEMLKKVVQTLRDRLVSKNKIDTLTVQGRMSGIIIGLIPFMLLGILYILEPSMMGGMFNTALGNFMLLIIVIMDAIGIVIIRKISCLEA